MTVEALSSTVDLEEAREKLLQSFAGLPTEALAEPNVVGAWSIREVIAHTLAWDAWGERTLAALQRGEEPPPLDEEAMNRAALEQYRLTPVPEIVQIMRTVRMPFLGRLAAMTDEERERPQFRIDGKILSADDFSDGFLAHDLEHASEIRAWRRAHHM